MNRREFLKATLASTVLATGAAAAPKSAPNVLFIAVDDLRPELGCFGSTYAQTPNIDRLAATGIRFTNHFVQVPTCGASRFALLTGRSPANSGVYSNNGALYSGKSALKPDRQDGAQSMPELFRRNGYHTVCIGKISHTPDGRVYNYGGKGNGRHELPNAWDELATPFGAWKRGWGAFFAYDGGRHREDGQGHRDVMEFTAETDEGLPDGLMAKAAVDKLKELKAKGKPFFLGVGFFKPHLPFVATRGDWEAMAKADVPLPPHQEKPDSAYWHKSGEFYKYKAPYPKTNPLAKEDQLKARRAYLACARYSDRQIGKVLAALDDLGLADNTVVVLWGDHGWHLGDSRLWGKHTPFERAVRSPLIVRAPGLKTAGKECDALVETLDIYPTLVELCAPAKRKTSAPLDGKSLAPLLHDPDGDIRQAALSYWGSATSVRTKTHRLIAKRGKAGPTKIELYDIRESPDPVKNIAAAEPALVKTLLKYVGPGGK
ncbi:sulfatase [bacterium]|nr:sulfatase [bacterium]